MKKDIVTTGWGLVQLLAVLLAAWAIVGLLCSFFGHYKIPLEWNKPLFEWDIWSNNVWHLRLIRLLAAGLAGSALATAGLVLQGLLRNPLAEPYISGISISYFLAVSSLDLTLSYNRDAGILPAPLLHDSFSRCLTLPYFFTRFLPFALKQRHAPSRALQTRQRGTSHK